MHLPLMQTLQYLLAPFSTEQFLSGHWTQQAVHLPGSAEKFQALFSWNSLNYLLNYHRLSESDVRFSLNGEALPESPDPKVWQDYLNQGATLIVHGLHCRVPSIAELVDGLRQELGYRTHANLYCSPAQQQGLTCHYDTHEVFILQIDGAKEWSVYPETVPCPTESLRSLSQAPPQTPPYLKCVLQPGEVLYIPRGHWHYGVACDRPSLHLTIGITCLTGLDWLAWLQRDLQSQADWRRSLPAIANGDPSALKAHLLTLQQQLTAALEDPNCLKRYLAELMGDEPADACISLPNQLEADLTEAIPPLTWAALPSLQVK
jgi:ribosomal protein L16 Arg81 hydroxylase